MEPVVGEYRWSDLASTLLGSLVSLTEFGQAIYTPSVTSHSDYCASCDVMDASQLTDIAKG